MPILIILTAVVIGAAGYFMFVDKKSTDKNGGVACTMEAKLCPDGTAVGRTGPNCEFAFCTSDLSAEASAEAEALYEGGGCFVVPVVVSGEDRESAEGRVAPTSPTLQQPDTPKIDSINWLPYVNTKYLFGFKHPESHIPYIAVDKESKILLPAGVNADRLVIAEDQSLIFTGEPKTLAFDVIQEDISTEDWLNTSLQRYIPSAQFVSQKDITFAGKKAVEIIGSGSGGSVYKLIVVKPGNFSIAIAQSAKSDFLDKILATFTFDVRGLR